MEEMKELTIRYAAVSDYNEVEAIMKQVHQLHVGWRPDIYKDADPVLPQSIFTHMVDEKSILLAEINGTVVALLSFEIRHVQSDKQVARDILFIDDLAVKEEYRGNGIGSELLQIIKEKVIREHLDGLELQVNARNNRAKLMYEKNGFSAKSINMELLL